jgi:hypothetical protein
VYEANQAAAERPELLPKKQSKQSVGSVGAQFDNEIETPGRQAGVKTASVRRNNLGATPPLRGSHDSLVRQNEKTEADGLERIEDDDDLADRIARKMLVPVPVSAKLAINGDLPEIRRYCRPWTASFLTDLSRAHAAQFHRPLIVSSAVRTVEYQKQLMETNGNAAAAEGDIASPHLTGATIDIAKDGLGRQELNWLRRWLLPLQTAGKIDVEEEFQQTCFHITVYKSYVPPAPVRLAAQPNVEQSKPGKPKPRQRKAGQRKTAMNKPGAAAGMASLG